MAIHILMKNGILHDNIRTKYLSDEGIDVMRFTNNDIYKNIEQVLNELKIFIENIEEAKKLG